MAAPCDLILAYTGLVVFGTLITLGWTTLLFWWLKKWCQKHNEEISPHTKRIWWIPMWTGIFERAIITTLVIWAPKLTAGFIGGWMAIKIAGGWGLLKDASTPNRATFFIGLLGNVVSFALAIAVGLLASPKSLDAFK